MSRYSNYDFEKKRAKSLMKFNDWSKQYSPHELKKINPQDVWMSCFETTLPKPLPRPHYVQVTFYLKRELDRLERYHSLTFNIDYAQNKNEAVCVMKIYEEIFKDVVRDDKEIALIFFVDEVKTFKKEDFGISRWIKEGDDGRLQYWLRERRELYCAMRKYFGEEIFQSILPICNTDFGDENGENYE